MSRRSSRFHALERSLAAPRKSRAKARTFTVMRLEGSAAAGPAINRPSRLPRDMEDQIAVVRGRAAAKPSRGLLQLEERLLRTQPAAPVAPAIQRHDHGAPPPAAVNARAQAMAAAAPPSDFRYNVESFEDAPADRAALPGTQCEARNPPAIAAAPAVTSAVTQVPQEARSDMRRRALNEDQRAIAASFERDVATMVGSAPATSRPEDRQWDDTLRNAANAPASANTTAAEGAAAPVARVRDAHEVFNQMGLAMNYANSFDLGAMDLAARFDHFDNELALAPQAAPVIPAAAAAQALSLDDFDLVADLAEISGAQSAPPAAVEAAIEPSPMRQDAQPASHT